MRSFRCDVCGQAVVFENSACMSCGARLGFALDERRVISIPADGSLVRCANAALARCNWLVPRPLSSNGSAPLCVSCRLTRTRPSDGDLDGLAAFARTEAAKRRLVYQLLDLDLPLIALQDDPGRGLAFDLLSSAQAPVITGHADGVVTIDLAEGHDAHREAMRVEMAEPYRTLLGHLRHEVGHYYWVVLVEGNGLLPAGGAALQRFREVFGDERADYGEALKRHYGEGPPAKWGERFVSSYATAHPWEDWAETFAHYLHIRDTIQTAAAYGMVVTGPDQAVSGAESLVAVPMEAFGPHENMQAIVATWLPLTYALNAVNRSMGKDDLYPFVLSESVIAKLEVVHDLVASGKRQLAR